MQVHNHALNQDWFFLKFRDGVVAVKDLFAKICEDGK